MWKVVGNVGGRIDVTLFEAASGRIYQETGPFGFVGTSHPVGVTIRKLFDQYKRH